MYFQDAVEQEFSIAAFDYHKTVDKDHGRIESRECWVTDEIEWLSMKDQWSQLQSICMMKPKLNSKRLNLAVSKT